MSGVSERDARRRAAFEAKRGTTPLPIRLDDSALPGGDRLQEDEFVVRTARDWGVAGTPLVLTTRRVVCPIDPSSRRIVSVELTDVVAVRLRKNRIGFATVVIDLRGDGKAFFAAHINAARVQADIQRMVDFARQPAAAEGAVSSSSGGDRYDQLRRVGELKAAGILSESEFEREKARILGQP